MATTTNSNWWPFSSYKPTPASKPAPTQKPRALTSEERDAFSHWQPRAFGARKELQEKAPAIHMAADSRKFASVIALRIGIPSFGLAGMASYFFGRGKRIGVNFGAGLAAGGVTLGTTYFTNTHQEETNEKLKRQLPHVKEGSTFEDIVVKLTKELCDSPRGLTKRVHP